jgi:hypothetical protein
MKQETEDGVYRTLKSETASGEMILKSCRRAETGRGLATMDVTPLSRRIAREYRGGSA